MIVIFDEAEEAGEEERGRMVVGKKRDYVCYSVLPDEGFFSIQNRMSKNVSTHCSIKQRLT